MSFKMDDSDQLVTYSCGSCGYALNLSSSDRDTAGIGYKYGREIRKGVVSFNSIDESRFSQREELKLRPYFSSKHSWGLLRKKTRLFCRNCRNFIGFFYEDGEDTDPSSPVSASSTVDGGSVGGGGIGSKKYRIDITALQPTAAAAAAAAGSSVANRR